MSSPQRAFSYQPLAKSPNESISSPHGFEVRLIYLHPGSFDDVVYCTIYHANILERQPRTEYTALSYVWGDATQTRSVQLCYHQLSTSEAAYAWPPAPSAGADCYKPFEVTINLEKALRYLRDSASGRILWADAICINQSDPKEKLSQIQSMGDVYKNAVEVRIWLGSLNDVQEVIEECQSRLAPIPEGSSSRLSTEEDLGAVLGCERNDIETALLAAKNYVTNAYSLLRENGKDGWVPDEQEALGIRIIAMQPWWQRVWVIQEATLSSDDPVMQCGDMQLRYREFLRMANRCMFRDAPSLLSQPQISLIVHGMFDEDYEPSKTSSASRLLDYLNCMSGNFKVSNPKDRINGVWGFVRMYGLHANTLILMMRAQYEQEHHKFFHQVAVWILFDPQPQSYPLRILENGPSNVKGVPSWVPTWTSRRWCGGNKTYGAPQSKHDILAQGVSMKNIYNIYGRCTEIRIHDALVLGRVITTLRLVPVPEREDTDVLREAILGVEEQIRKDLRSMGIPHADVKTQLRTFRGYLRLNFWDIDTREGSYSSENSATLEEFLGNGKKSKKRKDQQRSNKVSILQANHKVPSPSSIAKLGSFFEHSRDLVVGSKIVGHIFEDEDSPPCWQSADKLYLIPECRWVLGLRRNGSGYRYMYRVFISDLAWEQCKQMFDDQGTYDTYEDIVLV